MDEAEEILLSSLRSSGVSLPSGLSASSSSIKGLSPDALVSVCAQSLRLIRGAASASLPTSIPDAAAERFKVCADVAAVIKSIGYKDDLSFHQVVAPPFSFVRKRPICSLVDNDDSGEKTFILYSKNPYQRVYYE